jgi:hypothetical protein
MCAAEGGGEDRITNTPEANRNFVGARSISELPVRNDALLSGTRPLPPLRPLPSQLPAHGTPRRAPASLSAPAERFCAAVPPSPPPTSGRDSDRMCDTSDRVAAEGHQNAGKPNAHEFEISETLLPLPDGTEP